MDGTMVWYDYFRTLVLSLDLDDSYRNSEHTSTCNDCSSFRTDSDSKNKKIQKLKGQLMQLKPVGESNEKSPDGMVLRDASCMADMVNGLGLCLDAFGLFPTPIPLIHWINGATGWGHDFEYYLF